MLIRYLTGVIICALMNLPENEAQYAIHGNVDLGGEWDSIVYLSAINSLEQFNTSSLEFLINSSKIDPDGSFMLAGDNLPAEDRIYRLHFVKSDDPVNSIIIGGKDENHIHFVMNNSSNIRFEQGPESQKIGGAKITGHTANRVWSLLESQILNPYKVNRGNSEMQKTYNRQAVIRKLHHFSDTCSYPVISLIALKTAIEIEDELDKTEIKYYSDKANSITTSFESPYSSDFQREVEFLQFTGRQSAGISPYLYWLIAFLLIITIGVVLYLRLPKWNRELNNGKRLRQLHELTFREKKVFELMASGKSNKEISADLNIGLNTVKTHVSNIYSKLQINSRKEIRKYSEDNQLQF